MIRQNLNFSQIYDLTAFRVVVASRKECYEVMGIVHSIWKPIPGRFKDYISLPKANMYQSLHTAVIGPYGQKVEIQIRTKEMDRVARHGIAAHWKYKEGRKIDQKDDQRFAWLHQVMEFQTDANDSHGFLEAFRVDIFPYEVYVFTPAGEVIELPKGSTPVDFAYRIHTDVGHRCEGAKVNNNIVPLKYQLKSGDVIEILTQANHKPSRDWLKFVQTSRAKTNIRHWIKIQERESSIGLGKEVFEKELKKHKLNFSKLLKEGKILKALPKQRGIKSADDLFAAVGQGRVGVRQVINKFVQKEPQDEKASEKKAVRKDDKGIKIDGIDNVMVRFGKCCNPILGDRITGYITRGRGVTVHSVDCHFIEMADPERAIDTQWDESCKHVATVPIEVICDDKKGLLANITSSISSTETNIVNAKVRTTPDKKAVSIFEVEINNLEHLESVIHEIKKVKGVLKVTRIRP
jgi:GTP pyrophosphokinase